MPAPERPRRVVLAAASVAGGLGLAAIGLNARPRWEFRADYNRITSRLTTTLGAVVLMMLLVGIAYLFALRRMSAGVGERGSLWRRYVVGAAAFVAALWLINRLHLGGRIRHRPAQPEDPTSSKEAAPSHHVGTDLYVWLGVFLALLVVVTIVLARRARRERAERESAADESSPLAAARTALRGGSDPRSRVIDAYDAMEGALASGARLRREPQQTPEEWLAHVASDAPQVGSAAAELTALFQRARFSRLTIAESDAARAVDLLGELRTAVAAVVVSQ